VRHAETKRAFATTPWPKDDLKKIAVADLHIAPLNEDGVGYRTPTRIWSVALDGVLYVRAYHGPKSRWYRAAVRQAVGRIAFSGKTRDVVFEVADGSVNDRIDEAYSAKYGASPYLAPMISARARSATVRVTLRDANDRSDPKVGPAVSAARPPD
jgi:hypothetical protein